MKLAITVLLLCISSQAATYFVAASGADTNNGTSKATPWLHAPGMPSCASTCLSTTPVAGDSIILRGGDTFTVGTWTWSWSGTTTNCQLNPSAGTVVKTSCIYVGTDHTWFSGGSYARPILTLGNPFLTTRPASCTTDDTSISAINLGTQTFLIFDDFENVGACWQGATNANFITTSGNQVEVSNMYFHGWTFGSGSTDDDYHLIGGNMPKGNYILCDHNVFDGSDSSLGATAGAASGFSINNTCSEIAYNVFSHVSNGCICNPSSVHDNLLQFLYEPQGTQHGNLFETNTAQTATGTLYWYNNTAHNTNEGVGYWPETTSASSLNVYLFNNVSWHWRENSNGTNGVDGANCFMYDQGNGTSTVFMFNNTVDFPCQFHTLNASTSNCTYQNNHLIGFTGSTIAATFQSACGGTSTDSGSELYQSEATANGQGFVTGNNYAPTSIGNSTVGAGANLVSFCNGLSDSGAAAACKSGVSTVTEISGEGGQTVNIVAGSARPSVAAWDAGAFQFSAAVVTPAPALGMFADLLH